MSYSRDPLDDRRAPVRLVGSTLASLLLHALMAALLFAVLVRVSQEGATESVSGGEVITLERQTPLVVARQPTAAKAAVPVPHAPRIAPLRHAPFAQPAAQRRPQNQHELTQIAPSAPPNPRPIRQASPQPNPQPTQNIFEPKPQPAMPAAPISVPTIAPVAVSVKAPPSAAPSPAPKAVATLRPSPKPPLPSAAPSVRPASPAPAATVQPHPSPAPAVHVSAPPAPRPGVPSPSPTIAAARAKTPGTAPSPGPKGRGSPGPHAAGVPGKTQAARPIQVPPTASPRPRFAPAAPRGGVGNLNAKLRALLPHNAVHPSEKQYAPTISLKGRLHPTPPPDVLARTKYLYDVRGTGGEARVIMWVTAARKAGPTTICTGWLVRYVQPVRGGYALTPSNVPAANGTQIAIGGGHVEPPLSSFSAGLDPIVDGIVSQPCDGRRLVPYAGSAASSP